MNQDADNWDVLQSLFHFAEEHPETDLDALLAQACADPELRARAKTLILLARESSDDTRTDDTRTAAWSQRSQPPGRRIGPYAIVRLLGSGGIGTVYLVERLVGGVVQRAALKVLSLHAAGPAFTDRFAREQHILASLEHPHITRMLDAGLSDAGEPYLVMEYVDGVHLDTFCDDRSLDVAARLKLFLEVCDAVAYAHRNLVVHLDLKPSNILVSAKEDNVKLLDFGTSKLIQPDSLLTTTVMATPAYASPEQLRNEAVTTACDVYALGAILFELLSGRRPNQDSSVAIMIERSLKELPPEPITGAVTPEAAAHRGLTQTRLLNVLRGDLATIVAKCLSPRPKDRYASVDALITDVQRYLAGRPILARPQTTTYRLTKFVRRNRKAVVAGVLAAIALIATSSYALWRQEQAVIAGERALQMQTFMAQLFKLANSDYTGKPTATVPEFLQLGVTVLPDFIADSSDRRAAQLSLAESMFNNGAYRDAEPIFSAVVETSKKSHDIPAEAEAEAYAGDIEYVLGKPDLGYALTSHALSLAHAKGVAPSVRVEIEDIYASRREGAGYQSDQNLAILQEAADESVRRHLPERQIAAAANELALTLEQHGRLAEAEAMFRHTLDIYKREPYAICDQGEILYNLGSIRSQRQDIAGSLVYYRQAYESVRQCSGDDSLKTLEIQSYMANALIRVGNPQLVVPMLEEALPKWRKDVGSESSDMATPLLFLTRAYIATGNFVKAEHSAAELIHVLEGKYNPHSSTMGVCEEAWAQALAGQHRYREALVHAQIAVNAFPSNPNPGERANAAKALITLQGIQANLAKPSR
jgi:serine/threonine-protein kinase